MRPLLVLQNSLDDNINYHFGNATQWFVDAVFYEIPIVEGVSVPWAVIILIIGALYFTAFFKFVNIKGFRTAIHVVKGKYDAIDEVASSTNTNTALVQTKNEGKENGEVTHFQALTAAVSATVGLGNIAGVAIALTIGGPGATFWMIIAGLFGMSSKFVECTLGVKYREVAEDGTVYGGPMSYLKNGLKEKGFAKLGKVLAVIFAIMCVGGSFGGGNMFQVNQAFKLVEYVTGGEDSILYGNAWVFGLIMSVFVGIVILGGIKKIASVTDKLVPLMVIVYLLAILTILGLNYSKIPEAFTAIWQGAFNPSSMAGGLVGVIIQGFRRAAISNEAGIGSSAIAHSAVKTNYPASEGLVALLEPFIDTVVVCTMTALVLIITGQVSTGMEINFEQGVLLTASALESGVSWFPNVLAVAVVLFAFSSMITWSYYGYQSWSFLFGRGKKIEYTYKILFCVCTVIGSAVSLSSVINFSDAMVFAMLIPNMIGLFILRNKVKEELVRYKKVIGAKF
ncbi:MAG: alanine:cation symporter family protein [Bizionia sp.]|nr:alanine:cation symporter family protein [Bizionia sp.]